MLSAGNKPVCLVGENQCTMKGNLGSGLARGPPRRHCVVLVQKLFNRNYHELFSALACNLVASSGMVRRMVVTTGNLRSFGRLSLSHTGGSSLGAMSARGETESEAREGAHPTRAVRCE
jgi:hypothetical protein